MEQEINGKVQKINEEDYEIIKKIESDGSIKATNWYKENYECSISEAREAIKAIQEKYGVKRKGLHKPDDEEIMAKMDELHDKTGGTPDMSKLKEWFIQESGCNGDEASEAIRNAISNYNKANGNKGCMVTILLVTTASLSAFLLL